MAAAAVPIAASAAGAGVTALLNRGQRKNNLQAGTAPEISQAANNFGALFSRMSGGDFGSLMDNINGGLGRNATAAQVNMLGFDPASLGLGSVATDLLANPADATHGLFASMAPFEAEETARQVAGLREMFGTMGGRFGSNIASGEAELRARAGNEFARTRQQSLLDANSQRAQNFGLISQIGQQGEAQRRQEMLQALQMILGFSQPGAPVQQQSMWPGLLQAGATLGGAYLMRPRTPAPAGA